jgi:heat-inducible transcriptional repressor
LTGSAALVHTLATTEQRVAQLRFLPLREGQLLAVMVTSRGTVENRVVSIARVPDTSELERLHNYLNPLLGERTLSELRAYVARAASDERSEFTESARQMVEATALAGGAPRDVVIEGQTRLLGQPDFASVEKMRGVLSLLEERERLLELLDRTLASGGVQVLIGAETQLVDAQDLALITAPYGQEGGAAGTLGVIAPARTDYQKVVPLVGFAADLVTDLLEQKKH